MKKPKAKLKNEDGEQTIELLGFHGYLDHDAKEEPFISFTINIAPDELDRGDLDYKTTFRAIKELMNRHHDLLDLIIALGKGADYSTDFYWREHDLLLRIEIPVNHPCVKHLNLTK